jgi:hypothetical protein
LPQTAPPSECPSDRPAPRRPRLEWQSLSDLSPACGRLASSPAVPPIAATTRRRPPPQPRRPTRRPPGATLLWTRGEADGAARASPAWHPDSTHAAPALARAPIGAPRRRRCSGQHPALRRRLRMALLLQVSVPRRAGSAAPASNKGACAARRKPPAAGVAPSSARTAWQSAPGIAGLHQSPRYRWLAGAPALRTAVRNWKCVQKWTLGTPFEARGQHVARGAVPSPASSRGVFFVTTFEGVVGGAASAPPARSAPSPPPAPSA